MSQRLIVNPSWRSQFTHLWCYWDNAFSDAELDKIDILCDALPTEAAKVYDAKNELVLDEQKRMTDVGFIAPDTENDWIFQRLLNVASEVNARFFGFELNGFSYLQFGRYGDSGAFYDWHTDGSINAWPSGKDYEPRKLSFTLMLSNSKDYDGGKFQVNSGTVEEVKSERGRLVFFPSFLLHRVTPVTRGTRKTVVGWVVGPKFK
jgi:PKHD-type hydroxylase